MAFNANAILELLDNNAPAQALAQLKKARKKDAQLLFLEGESHRQLGSFETALKTYAKALHIADVAEEEISAVDVLINAAVFDERFLVGSEHIDIDQMIAAYRLDPAGAVIRIIRAVLLIVADVERRHNAALRRFSHTYYALPLVGYPYIKPVGRGQVEGAVNAASVG